MQTIETYDFSGKRVLIRVDFNVPMNGEFKITDDTRMRASIPTIRKIIGKGGAVVIMSHLGRPGGKIVESLSMKHLANHLSELLGGTPVTVASDCVGEEVEKMTETLKPGQVLLLENLRFYEEELKGDVEFARQLAKLGDCWVNDAFGTAHRAHASTAVIARFFPNDKMFGLLVDDEIENLEKVFVCPAHPVTAIIGGSKVSSKIIIIENLLDKVDNLIIGGGMIFTFVKAMGGQVGASLCEDDFIDVAMSILEKAKEKGVDLVIAPDCVVADKFANNANIRVVSTSAIEEGWMGLDVGPQTIKIIRGMIENSATILWNGPAGVFEMDNFAAGTRAVGDAIVAATRKGAFSLVGGGDSVSAVNKFGIAKEVSYISTAGGALLEYLEGKELPGIAAVQK